MAEADVFLVAVPGLEGPLEAEARACGFSNVTRVPGGVEIAGGLEAAAQANLVLRCAVRVLWRVATFRALHMAQLDKRARKVAWGAFLRPDTPVRVEATCRRSRIYHRKGAAERVARAIADCGVPLARDDSAEVSVKVRIDDDLCTISVDTTGEALHRRGHKTFVGKAPLRETMAAGFLQVMGFDGTQSVVDPMCGSGTIVLEAAEIAAGLVPGRSRAFAYQRLAGAPTGSDDGTDCGGGSLRRPYLESKDAVGGRGPAPFFLGFDRDQGAIRGAADNVERAGVAGIVRFACQPISVLAPPEAAPGIVLTNPPYGVRIGERKLLFGLYGALGQVLRDRFIGWHIGIVTSDGGLAKATGLSLEAFGPVDHSGTKVQLWHGRVH